MKTRNLFSEKKNLSFFKVAAAMSLLISGAFLNLNAQVTIGSDAMPKATLDVVASNAASDTVAEGVIAPRLTGDQIKAKNGAYKLAQNGAIVYATSVPAALPVSAKTANIAAAGYYYYDALAGSNADGSDGVWKSFGGGGAKTVKSHIITTPTPFWEMPVDVDLVVLNLTTSGTVEIKMPVGSHVPDGKTVQFTMNHHSRFVIVNAAGVSTTYLLNYGRVGADANSMDSGITMVYIADLEKWSWVSGAF